MGSYVDANGYHVDRGWSEYNFTNDEKSKAAGYKRNISKYVKVGENYAKEAMNVIEKNDGHDISFFKGVVYAAAYLKEYYSKSNPTCRDDEISDFLLKAYKLKHVSEKIDFYNKKISLSQENTLNDRKEKIEELVKLEKEVDSSKKVNLIKNSLVKQYEEIDEEINKAKWTRNPLFGK